MTRERVLVAMSGGVDSSVAAAMLVDQGYDVVGATMKPFCHGEDVPDRPCCSLDSVNDARRVCEQLGVPHYVLNLETRFGHDVVDNFVDEYARGRTPIASRTCDGETLPLWHADPPEAAIPRRSSAISRDSLSVPGTEMLEIWGARVAPRP